MIKKFISKLLGKSEGVGAARGKRVEVPKSAHGIDPLAAGPARAAVLGLSEQLGNELLDHANKFRMRQPRARAMASSSGDGLVATGSVARSSSARSLSESL